jgi:hypothetical protein
VHKKNKSCVPNKLKNVKEFISGISTEVNFLIKPLKDGDG